MQGEKGEPASVITADGSLMFDMARPTKLKGIKVKFPAIAFTFQSISCHFRSINQDD